MLRTAVIEDERESAERLKEFIGRYGKEKNIAVETAVYPDAMEFLTEYRCDRDVIFMDIDLPYMNGMDAAARLRQVDDEVCLVFVTNLAQYAIRGYVVRALDYILKPIQYGQFELAMNRAGRLSPQREKHAVLLQTRTGRKRIDLDEVSYIEVQGHDLIFHIGDRTETVRSTIREAGQQFSSRGFSRAGNSYLVNLKFVEQLDGSDVVVNGERIPVSRGHRKEFLEDVTNYYGVFGGRK